MAGAWQAPRAPKARLSPSVWCVQGPIIPLGMIGPLVTTRQTASPNIRGPLAFAPENRTPPDKSRSERPLLSIWHGYACPEPHFPFILNSPAIVTTGRIPMRCYFSLALLMLFPLILFGQGTEDLGVLTPAQSGPPPDQHLEIWLKTEFDQLVAQRRAAFETTLKSEASCRNWQEERRRFFLDQIGPLPERTPLNPVVVGTLQGKGYRIEKILLESRPGFHVTGNLYLPETPPPWPAVLVPCGHSHDGKAVGQYQRASILLAKHGLAALCYDPIGQGERYQMLDRTQERRVFDDAPHVSTPHPNVRLMCTTEHTMMGLGSALLGGNVAQYRIWDGMRIIDYLQSRPDIRPDKIGCTGNSGGGTETAYLMALDDRIAAAAPGCYLTTFQRLIETKGPQDGEQNIFGQIAFGMDEADYCIMRAPKPTLICAGTRDATFDFGGTWQLFGEAKRFYSRLGYPESIDLAAPDAPHGFTIQLREAVTRFMSRWLLDKEVVVREVESLPDTLTDEQLRAYNEPDWTAQDLQCTPGGQVLLLPGERSVFQINTDLAVALKASRSQPWSALDPAGKRRLIRKVIGAKEGAPPPPNTMVVGTAFRGDTTIHKLTLEVAPGLRLPALAFLPQQPSGAFTLYLHGRSMREDAAPGGPIDALVKQGHTVVSAELRGIGETETGVRRQAFGAGRFGRDNLEILTAYLMGKSYVGMRTEDVASWLQVLRSGTLPFPPAKEIHLVAIGEATIPALHAATLQPEAFATVSLQGMIPSWEPIVQGPECFDQSVNVVHGVLRHYDLPDLVDLLDPKKVSRPNPVNVMGLPIP